MSSNTRRAALTVLALVGSSALTVGVAPTEAAPQLRAQRAAAASAAAPAVPVPAADAVAIARRHLSEHAADFGLSQGDVAALRVSSTVPTEHNGMTDVYFQQQLNSLDIVNALLNVTVLADGTVLRVASSAVPSAAKVADDAGPMISDTAAARKAATALGLTPTESFASDDLAIGASRERTLGDGGISSDPVTAQLAYVRTAKGDLRLAWQVVVNQLDGAHWWQISMDADTGAEVARDDWVDNDTYNVYPDPVQAPTFGNRSVVTNPATSASPYGWHDTNGVVGAESTLTIGNNVSAYTDTDADNLPDGGSQPSGGSGLAFDFPLDLTAAPSTYKPAAVTNLFYVNNRIHDIFDHYGFTAAAGNFQANNYGAAGAGNDAVRAEAQDGGGVNNANFSTPPDGSSPRMQMYLWNMTTPGRDGDLDNDVIIHEYGHGISNRLTGGPATTSCLNNGEQAGEGWSDFFALMLTQTTPTEDPNGRGIGTYVFGQPTDGVGIRTQKYNTDLTKNTFTYDSIKTLAAPHGLGSVWAEMLWDLNWDLVDKYGYSADLLAGNAGNTKALQLVVDGLKLQPCSPGFVDARNAILAADQATGGADKCLIWGAFARRGLGFSATQGSTSSATDGVQAFDLPVECQPVSLTRTATPNPVEAGRQLTYGFTATSTTVGATGVTISSTLNPNTAYVAGSATCNGTYDSSTKVVTMPIGTVTAGASRTCSFRVRVAAGSFGTTTFADDVEPDLSAWTATHGAGAIDWGLSTAAANSPTHSAFAADSATVSDQYLRTTAPIAVAAGDSLSFWQRRGLESGFDGGVVEVSTNGGSTWTDLGQAVFSENGYNATISTGQGSPIAGRQAFSGTTTAFVRSTASLAAYVGQSVLVRFRAATDTSVAGVGWYVDDVTVGKVVEAVNTATLTATGVPSQSSTVVVPVVEPVASAPEPPTVASTTPAAGGVTVGFTPGDDGFSPVTSFGVECLSPDGGVAGTVTGSASPLTVVGLSAGKAYSCRARATNALGTSAYGAAGATVTVPVPPVTSAPAPTSTPTPPGPAATVPGRPTAVKAKVLSPTSVKVSFTPGASGGSAVTSYSVSCTGSGGVKRGASGTKTSLKVKGLTPGKAYRCKVTATNAVGTSKAGVSKKVKTPARGRVRAPEVSPALPAAKRT